ncbi:cytochrome c oxidase assembly protein [Nonomuraea sp. NPDC052634]|uniref:cytochrome c oxidase assembly protein n=1 Tax=Nonomuraea sp. NPDC052634 TaxID=3155813 RepID=UPI0034230F22
MAVSLRVDARPGARRSARWYPALVAGAFVGTGALVLVAALRFGGGAGTPRIAGLPTAGPVTEWGLPLARLAYELCAAACVGTLLAACVLAPAAAPERERCLRAAGWWALGWAFCSLLTYLLTLSSFIPMPVANLLAEPGMLGFGAGLPQTRALLLVVAITFVVATATMAPRLPRWLPLVLAVAGLLPPAYVGHAASAGDHDLAVSGLMVHLAAMATWVGGLGAVLVHFRRSRDLPVVLRRFSAVALCCFAAVAFSGAVSGWVRLGTPSGLWQTPYGLLLLAKVATLAVLGWFGWTHRRRTVGGVADRGVRRTFVRLAAGELVVMAVAMGLAVGLARTPPPAGGDAGGHAHPALEYALAPFSPAALLTEVRLDPLLVLLLALPAAAYLIWTRRVPSWPRARTAAWYAGLALAALVLIGGVSGYARAMVSAQALQHAVLALAVPLLLAAGAPMTPAARAMSRPLGGVSSSPRVLALLATAWPALAFLLYGTDWLTWSLTGYAEHLVTELLFLGVGLATAWVLVGADRPAVPPAWRRGLAAVAGLTYVGVGACLLLGSPVAARWFALARPHDAPDLITDQYLAGAVFLIVPLLTLAPVVRLLGPSRSSERG